MRLKALVMAGAIVVTFRSFSTGCDQPVLCAATVADATQQQGQGMHGSFSRADTMNFMAAIGPSFKRGYVDELPVSNADVGQTLARLLGLKIPFRGSLRGRVIDDVYPMAVSSLSDVGKSSYRYNRAAARLGRQR